MHACHLLTAVTSHSSGIGLLADVGHHLFSHTLWQHSATALLVEVQQHVHHEAVAIHTRPMVSSCKAGALASASLIADGILPFSLGLHANSTVLFTRVSWSTLASEYLGLHRCLCASTSSLSYSLHAVNGCLKRAVSDAVLYALGLNT